MRPGAKEPGRGAQESTGGFLTVTSPKSPQYIICFLTSCSIFDIPRPAGQPGDPNWRTNGGSWAKNKCGDAEKETDTCGGTPVEGTIHHPDPDHSAVIPQQRLNFE